MENPDIKLYKTWNDRWKGSQDQEQLTFLGKMIFKTKKTAITRALSDIGIKTVLEAGCGLGHTLLVYSNLGYDCCGIDVSEESVRTCLKKGLDARVEKLEEVDENFDLVSSDGMLEHFLNFEPYARHMMRISRRYVLLIQPNHGSFTGKTLVYFAELLRGKQNVFEYNYRIDDFVIVFENNGFKNIANLPLFFDVFRLLLFEKI